MSTETEEITDLLKKLVDVRTLDSRLWDTADVAAYLKLNPAHVRRSILTRGDFPKPMDIPGSGAEPITRYDPEDVRDWAKRHQR